MKVLTVVKYFSGIKPDVPAGGRAETTHGTIDGMRPLASLAGCFSRPPPQNGKAAGTEISRLVQRDLVEELTKIS